MLFFITKTIDFTILVYTVYYTFANILYNILYSQMNSYVSTDTISRLSKKHSGRRNSHMTDMIKCTPQELDFGYTDQWTCGDIDISLQQSELIHLDSVIKIKL